MERVRKFFSKGENFNDSSAIEKADDLFGAKKYEDVCRILGDERLQTNVDALWRLSRAMYKISENQPDEKRQQYIDDAHRTINRALDLKQDDPNVHKWTAVILSAKKRHQTPTEAIKNMTLEKMHLMWSLELNPEDYSVLHMLGNWCFTIASLSRLQRSLICFFYGEPPASSYEEAYDFFRKAEEIKGKYYIPNIYMLGKACYCMKKYYKARYYFEMAESLTPHTTFEKSCQEEAKVMNEKIDLVDLSEGAAFNDFAN